MSYNNSRYGGRDGSGGILTTNMFRLTPCQEGNGIYKHVVIFDPADCPPRVRAAALHSYDGIGGKDFVLRGDVLIMREQLPETSYLFRTSSGKHEVNVTIKMGTRIDYSEGGNQTSTINEVLALNSICLKRTLKMFPGVVEMGRSFVDLNKTAGRPISGLNLHNGFGISATWRDGGAYAEIDLSTRIISEKSVWEMYREDRSFREDDLEGTGIMTKYNNMLYRFKGFDKSQTPLSTFTKRVKNADGGIEEKQISYEEYTNQTYGVQKIPDPGKQFMIIATYRGDRKADGTREEREVRLIPSLCYVVGYNRKQECDMRLRRDVTSETKMKMHERIDRLKKLVDDFNRVCPATCAKGHVMTNVNRDAIDSDGHKCANCDSTDVVYACKKCMYWLCMRCAQDKVEKCGFKASIEAKMVEVKSNVIPQADVITGNGALIRGEPGSWDRFHDYRLTEPFNLDNWIFFCERRADGIIDKVISMLKDVAFKMNMFVRDPRVVIISDSSHSDEYERALLREKEWPQLCFVLLNSQHKPSYEAAKRVFTRFEVVSQVATSMKLTSKNTMSFVTKIAIQIAAKLGHAPWRVPINSFPGQTGADVMFVGIDAANGSGGTRVLAMISTVDGTRCEHYWNQSRRFRDCDAGAIIKEMTLEAIEAHKMKNGKYPAHVIVYRNGVSDAELRGIEAPRTGEYAQMMAAFEDRRISPFLDYILVIRTGTLRLFSDKGNPAPGTVVDSLITSNPHDPTLGAPRSDFYMVSQKTNEGCVRPTHYRIIVNSSFLTRENLEEITYKLAHLYYNWTGTVAVPAPVLLAQKLTRMIVEHRIDVTPAGLKEFTYYI